MTILRRLDSPPAGLRGDGSFRASVLLLGALLNGPGIRDCSSCFFPQWQSLGPRIVSLRGYDTADAPEGVVRGAASAAVSQSWT